MVEKIAELDDELTMKFLEAQEISVDELKACASQGRPCQQSCACFLRFFIKEQGRAGSA
jgi:translation elongation factor EF-G